MSIQLTLLLYQKVVFLVGYDWPNYIPSNLWSVLKTLETDCEYSKYVSHLYALRLIFPSRIISGLFGLNDKTASLEIVVVLFQNYIPEVVRGITDLFMPCF